LLINSDVFLRASACAMRGIRLAAG